MLSLLNLLARCVWILNIFSSFFLSFHLLNYPYQPMISALLLDKNKKLKTWQTKKKETTTIKWKKNKTVVFIPTLFQSRNFNIAGTSLSLFVFSIHGSQHVRKEWKLWSLRQQKHAGDEERNNRNKWKHIIQRIKSTTKSRVHILLCACECVCFFLNMSQSMCDIVYQKHKASRENRRLIQSILNHQIKWEN